MKTVSVLSRKGGAGKTTVSVSLAVAAQQAGLRTVLVDIDPMRSAAVVLAKRADSASLLLETNAQKLRAVQGLCRREGCDLLIVDTPPAPEADVQRAIDASDFCLAVARPSALDLSALDETLRLIARRGRPGLVVLNQCPPTRGGAEAVLTRTAIDRFAFAQVPLSQVKLRSRVAYQHASGQQRGVTEWDRASDAAADVLRLLAEVCAASRRRSRQRPRGVRSRELRRGRQPRL
jgi:chromosome partitioning protein